MPSEIRERNCRGIAAVESLFGGRSRNALEADDPGCKVVLAGIADLIGSIFQARRSERQ